MYNSCRTGTLYVKQWLFESGSHTTSIPIFQHKTDIYIYIRHPELERWHTKGTGFKCKPPSAKEIRNQRPANSWDFRFIYELHLFYRMNYDELLTVIGEFGRYQMLIYVLVCIASMISSIITFSQVFTIANVDHWCAVGEWSDQIDDCLPASGDNYLDCIHNYRDASIPSKGEIYDKCQRFNVSYQDTWGLGYFAGEFTNTTETCVDGWVYDHSQYRSTVVTEFHLVCDNGNYPGLEKSLYFVGCFIGNLLFGTISDKYGRYKAFYISVTATAITGLSIAVCRTYWTFVLVRFVSGCSNMIYALAFTIGIEAVGPSKRVWAGIVICLFYSAGYMVLAILAYLIPYWRTLQVTIFVPFVLLFLYVCFLPESVRWLISNKRYEEAEKVILKTARINKATGRLPSDMMDQLKKDEEAESEQRKRVEKPYIQDLFKSKDLRFKIPNIVFNWMINALVYFGLSLSTSSLGGNNYVAFFISGAVEIPAYLLSIPAIESSLGRRGSIVLFEVIGGAACILTAFTPLGNWRIAVALLGKFCISASFAIIYFYTAEILPTSVRTVGIALCTTASNLTVALASLILLLSAIWEELPYLIFGTFTIVGGLLVLLLPETRGCPLPEHLTTADPVRKPEKEFSPLVSSTEV
ncbi:organic cation transporter protein-like isoform X3 [Apostichopus japonicus]|uniref:organic cation transporter protein-like isoform X3 n=1 Tax=Stichopus japonicus TaxID=307972 RepID=UPI003AB18744